MVSVAMQQIALAWILLALFGQVADRRLEDFSRPNSTTTTPETIAEVSAESLDVYDRPDEACYATGTLQRGERVKIRAALAGGWLAIDPPAATICWVERSALEPVPRSPGQTGHVAGRSTADDDRRASIMIAKSQAMMRSGNPQARLPGPPLGRVDEGTTVRLVDREPLEIGRGRSKTVWYAIVPPAGMCCYVRGEGTRRLKVSGETEPATQEVYQTARYATLADENLPLVGVSPAVAAEIKAVDATQQWMRANQAIAQWQLGAVRSRYEAILKRAGNDPSVEEAIRVRLARATRDEQAARAAKTIDEILAQSHRRDEEVAVQKRLVAAAGRSRARAYSAVGYMQASTEKIDGRKLYVLIGKDGSTLAYLDIPPGLDTDRLIAHRVGVRGDPHYNEELGSRLITVRDLEKMESRR